MLRLYIGRPHRVAPTFGGLKPPLRPKSGGFRFYGGILSHKWNDVKDYFNLFLPPSTQRARRGAGRGENRGSGEWTDTDVMDFVDGLHWWNSEDIQAHQWMWGRKEFTGYTGWGRIEDRKAG